MSDETKRSLASAEPSERMAAGAAAAEHLPPVEHAPRLDEEPEEEDTSTEPPSGVGELVDERNETARPEPERPARDRARPASEAKKHHKNKLPGNNVRRIRLEKMLSKAELARRANLSVLTVDRIEKGYGCRMDTKRKILEALGLSLADRVRVFGEEE